MKQNILQHHKLEVIDNLNDVLLENIYLPFALDELLSKKITEENVGTIHLWRHQKAFVMGPRDYRLPFVQKAIDWLSENGYQVMVRHSGGAAVPLDEGVINISLILPNSNHVYQKNIDFERMYQFINRILQVHEYKVDKGEIVGSYCPGDFDLSIHGKKFAGIAQRRKLKSTIIQAFINVEGSGTKRGELVKEFYEIASNGGSIGSYPKIETKKIASLAELIIPFSSQKFITDLRNILVTAGVVHLSEEEDFHAIELIAEQMQSRYPIDGR